MQTIHGIPFNGVNPEVWQALAGVAYHEAHFPATRHYTFMVEFEAILTHQTPIMQDEVQPNDGPTPA